MDVTPTSINQALFPEITLEWQMTEAERCAVVAILDRTRPKVAIEVGTDRGGSLLVLSKYAGKAYSLDIDPTCQARLGTLCPNVEFVTGKSGDTLPPLLATLQAEQAPLGFVLIDGDHSRQGVRRDIESLLRFRPTQPLYVLMHDSFNPSCRQGMREANWAANPHVHCVELDFVTGQFVHEPHVRDFRQMWCGLAFAYLDPRPRTGPLTVHSKEPLLYETVHQGSVHVAPPLPRRIVSGLVRRARRLLGAAQSAARPASRG